MKELIKGSFQILSYKLFGAFSAFVSSVLISKLFGTSVFGEYSLMISIVSFTSMFNILGLDLFLIQKINEISDKGKSYKLILRSARYFFWTGITICLIFIFISHKLSFSLFGGDRKIQLLMLGFIIISFSSIKITSSIYRAHQSIVRYSINENLLIQIPLVSIFLILYILEKNTIDPIWIYFVIVFSSSLISLLLISKYLHREYRVFKSSTTYFNEKILTQSLPMMLTSTIIFTMSYLDTFMISSILGNFHVGIYSGIMKLSIPLVFLAGATSSFLAPKISRKYSEGKLEEVKMMYKSALVYLLFFGGITLGILIFYSDFFLGLFGEEYIQYTSSYYIYLAANFVSGCLLGPIGYFLVMTKNQFLFLKILIVAILVNIVLNYILIPDYGIAGASLATLVSTVIWKSWGFLFLKYKKII